jgi:hypothetical protein
MFSACIDASNADAVLPARNIPIYRNIRSRQITATPRKQIESLTYQFILKSPSQTVLTLRLILYYYPYKKSKDCSAYPPAEPSTVKRKI